MVCVLIDDLEPALARELEELVQLGFGMLVQRRDSYIESSSLHAETSSWARNPAAVPLREAVRLLCRRARMARRRSPSPISPLRSNARCPAMT